MKTFTRSGVFILIILVIVSLQSSVGGTADCNQLSTFHVCQSSGPSFDLTLMPEFVDLVPNSGPVNLTLELRVEVTDPDGVSFVVGSYKNSSSSKWNNITMKRDMSTGDPDDFVAWPLNYTMNEPSFVVIWDIKFFANDSLDNWNISNVHQISICRQGSTYTTTDFPIAPLIIAAGFLTIIVLILFVIYGERVTRWSASSVPSLCRERGELALAANSCE
ncbi:MAG: hypothetical protein JW779_02100 [Candidatus Thorarchaeota archaeon]|nr:hypothetical protein [Candidatus Thorarchaeota archaeon]